MMDTDKNLEAMITEAHKQLKSEIAASEKGTHERIAKVES